MIQLICKHTDFILTPEDIDYSTFPYSDHPPILFGQGQHKHYYSPKLLWLEVESRVHMDDKSYDFAYYLSEKGFILAVV
jgi:DNA processing protein